jgi:hypothetical protein
MSRAAPERRRRRANEPARAWQRMLSGRRLDLLDPSPLDIEIRDIAHGLARVARWNGQTEGEHPFTVAQHSLLVELIVRETAPEAGPADLLAALLHDAPEYVVGDLISPFKAVIGEAYKGVEERLSHAVALRFAIPADTGGARRRRIKTADTIAAYHEAVALAGFSPDEARSIFGAPVIPADSLGTYLVPWPTGEVEERFLARFHALEGARRPAG